MVVLSSNYFVLLICLSFSAKFVAGDAKSDLIDLAIKLGAPFAQTALDRLHGEIFGSGRAARSSDCTIINKSKYKFKLVGNSCSHGDYSSGLFPEYNINSKTSSVFGMESHGFLTGVECTTKYDSTDGSGTYFEVRSDNPYAGNVEGSENYSKSLRVMRTTGGGNNNQVRWVVEDAEKVGSLLPTGPVGGKTTKPTRSPKTTTRRRPTPRTTKRPTKRPNKSPNTNPNKKTNI